MSEPAIVTFADLLAATAGPGPLWTQSSADLNVNLITFDAGQGVPPHANHEVDVLIVVVAGDGFLEVDQVSRPIRAGQACLVPKGATRALRSGGGPFAYLTCHRRRAGLWPEGLPRS
jgi:mannose-6-phosphate isomerase-like protein (cupin superfamily)